MSPNDNERSLMDRREALKRVSALLGGAALVGSSALWSGCAPKDAATVAEGGAATPFTPFTPDEIAFLDEVADTILPETSTPGAKAAKTGALMAVMVTDCYEPKDQAIFREGMTKLEEASQSANKTSFVASTPAQRLSLLEGLDQEQLAYTKSRTGDQPTHFFRMMKELSLLGYFTSEIGVTQAQRYAESPGRYDPCLPYVKGETSWAAHA